MWGGVFAFYVFARILFIMAPETFLICMLSYVFMLDKLVSFPRYFLRKANDSVFLENLEDMLVWLDIHTTLYCITCRNRMSFFFTLHQLLCNRTQEL